MTRIRAASGIQRTMKACGNSVRRAKTRVKVSKYRPMGATQRSGTEAMSAVKYVVTLSIKLHGTADRPIQRRRRNRYSRDRCGRCSVSAAGRDGLASPGATPPPGWARHTSAAHPRIMAPSAQ